MAAMQAKIPCINRLTDPGSRYAHAGSIEKRSNAIVILIFNI